MRENRAVRRSSRREGLHPLRKAEWNHRASCHDCDTTRLWDTIAGRDVTRPFRAIVIPRKDGKVKPPEIVALLREKPASFLKRG